MPRIVAMLLPTDDEIEAAVDRLEQVRNFRRVVLQIAVDGDDDPARRFDEARRKGRRLAEVATQLDRPGASDDAGRSLRLHSNFRQSSRRR